MGQFVKTMALQELQNMERYIGSQYYLGILRTGDVLYLLRGFLRNLALFPTICASSINHKL